MSSSLLIIIFLILSVELYAKVDTDSQQQTTDSAAAMSATQTVKQPVEQPPEGAALSFLANQVTHKTALTDTDKKVARSDDALRVSLGLLVILVMIFSLAWLMKKMAYKSMSGQGKLKIIASLNLGTKEKIALLQVGEQQLLVGITAHQINTLYVLGDRTYQLAEQNISTAEVPDNFSSVLKAQTP